MIPNEQKNVPLTLSIVVIIRGPVVEPTLNHNHSNLKYKFELERIFSALP